MNFMRTFSIHQVRNTLIAVLLVVGFGVAYYFNSPAVSPSVVEAGTAQNISGWAWTDTYGWISLNSIDCDKDNNGHKDVFCGGDNTTGTVQNYGVNVSTTNRASGGTGDFSGNAWSDNIGWVSFDRALTGNPPAAPFNGGVGTIAQVDWSTGKVTGWAKVLGATTWDGWIKLSDDTIGAWSGKGLSITGGKLSGYAWGGGNGTGTDGATGWVDFAPTINGVPIGAQISAPPCVATMGYNTSDPNMIWGSCNPTVACGAPGYPSDGSTYTNVPGVVVGACTEGGVPTGGTTVVSCGNAATLICPAAVPPSTTKHWWQF
jgi:hypothetical protein